MRAFSVCGELLFVAVCGILIAASLFADTGSRCMSFSTCSSRAPECGPVVVMRGLSCAKARGASRTRAGPWVSYPRLRILIHCTTSEVPDIRLLKSFPLFTALSSSKHSYYVSRLVGSISSFFLILFHGLNKRWERMYKIPPLPPMFNHYFSV